MKKLKLFLTGLFAMTFAVAGVNAAEVKNARELNACVNAFDECKLTADIVEDGETLAESAGLLEIDNNVVIDLNGHTLTLKENVNEDPSEVVGAEISLDGGNVTIKNGNLVQESKGNVAAVNVYGGATLNIEELNINVTSEINITKKGNQQIPRAINLSGAAAKSVGTLNVGKNTTVNVDNGYGIVISTFSNATMNGTWTTKDSVITIKNADLKGIGNNAIKSTNVTFEAGEYLSDGIVLDIKNGTWTFNGGSFTSKSNDAVHIGAVPSNKNGEKVENGLVVAINDGKFETQSNVHKPLHSDEISGFVNKGVFVAPVVEYELVEGYEAEGKVRVVENDITYVGTKSAITIVESTNGKVEADKEEAVAGQEVILVATPDENYKLDTMTVVDENGNNIEVVDGKFVMPGSAVTVTATFKSLIAEDTPGTGSTPDEEIPSDTPTEETPNTLDSLPVYLIGGAVATLSLVSLGYTFKKRFEG